MNREDIIRMARDAGSIDSEEVIETVWNAFSAAEREACAKLCFEIEQSEPRTDRIAWEHGTVDCAAAITALRAALEQPEQEPVAWIQSNHLQKAQQEPFLCRVEPMQRLPDFVPLYTHPPHREWQGLTDGEIIDAVRDSDLDWQQGWTLEDSEPNRYTQFARAIEAALKEKNHE